MSKKIESPKIFNSTLSGRKYFYCKENELFALNSLEVLDRNQFIYRYLKSSGFQAIVFIDLAPNSQLRKRYQVITYDLASYCVFSSDGQKILKQQENKNDLQQLITSMREKVNTDVKKTEESYGNTNQVVPVQDKLLSVRGIRKYLPEMEKDFYNKFYDHIAPFFIKREYGFSDLKFALVMAEDFLTSATNQNTDFKSLFNCFPQKTIDEEYNKTILVVCNICGDTDQDKIKKKHGIDLVWVEPAKDNEVKNLLLRYKLLDPDLFYYSLSDIDLLIDVIKDYAHHIDNTLSEIAALELCYGNVKMKTELSNFIKAHLPVRMPQKIGKKGILSENNNKAALDIGRFPLKRSAADTVNMKMEEKEMKRKEAWKGVIIAPEVKDRLMSLAKHFSEGSPAASQGLLLYGPPGTGKTLIAKALSESMECTWFPLDISDLKAEHVGGSGQYVKNIWQRALAQPRAIIFVDECEGAFGRRGGTETDSFVTDIVSSFLPQWDGFNKQKTVWVIGATNRRDLIDPAILSRFGDTIEIGLPDEQQRIEVLKNELNVIGTCNDLPPETGKLTQGMSGRDLESLAGRMVREQGDTAITTDVLALHTEAIRRQGSSKTDDNAKWERLVLSEEVMEELKTTVNLLKNTEAVSKRGINVPKGMLLYGPPGTGKTQIARTLANETGIRFITAKTADLKAGTLGNSGQKVRELFERARDSLPCILFIDELDIIAPIRGSFNSDQYTQEIVGQLLQEIDGVTPNEQPIFILAASNRLDQIDAAILSRLQRRIEIPVPDLIGRQRLFQVLLLGKPISFDIEEASKQLANMTEGKSGRDLRNWIEYAENKAIGRAIKLGNLDAVTIMLEDFQ